MEKMDEVMPFHYFDDAQLFQRMGFSVLFVIDSVLDQQKLRDSLETLAKKYEWRKLGGRLRTNKSGKLEHHIPHEYTEKRPPINFFHTDHDMPKSSHPLASQLPKATGTPSVVSDPDLFKDLSYHPKTPRTLRDYINADIAQMGLHIVSFHDATCVSVSFPHTLCDIMGFTVILRAWMCILNGRDEEIPKLCGVDSDPLAQFGLNLKEPHKLEDKQLSYFTLFRQYILRNIGIFLFGSRKRLVCVPKPFLRQLQESATQAMAENPDAPPFLSEGDILCAWWCRMVVSQLTNNLDQTVLLNNIQDLRNLLSPDLLPTGFSYLSNAVGLLTAMIPAKTVLKEHLAFTAAKVRQSIIDFGSRPQAEAYAALIRKDSFKFHPWFGQGSFHVITYSNLTKSKFFEVNFSSAAVEGGGEDGSVEVRPSYMYSWEGFYLPNLFYILGKDREGNYWLSGNLNNSTWEKLTEALKEYHD